MKLNNLLLLAMLALTAAAHAADRVKLDSGAPPSARRAMLNRLPATNRMEIGIGLPRHNEDQMNTLFHQMYDTRSTNFHRYLTPEQFGEQFGATREDYQLVMEYAKSNNLQIVRQFGNRAFVNVSGTVADLERTFQVHLGTFQHPAENRVFFGPDVEPTVEVGLPIRYLTGLDNYLAPKPHGKRMPLGGQQEGGSGINAQYLGGDFRSAYFPGVSLNGSGQVIGVYEPEGYNTGDITNYEGLAGITNVPLHNILNTYSGAEGHDESTSDIELVIAMAPGIAGVNVYEGSNDVTILNEMACPTEHEALPNQIACSWGDIESDTNIIPQLQEMAMQGQTFFQALGDNGAFENGINTNSDQPLLYMVVVGGTQLITTNGPNWLAEVVWHEDPSTNFQTFSTEGGVLNQVPIPDFQQPVSMAANGGSTNYRNVPDVALVAQDIEIVVSKTNSSGVYGVEHIGWKGTSASAPLWAGIAALVNQQGASRGLPPVGYMLPAIYNIGESPAYGSCFHDITNGNNTWSNSVTGANSANLYYATNGYDLCTGWGTPAGLSFINALLDFSGPIFVDFNYTGSSNNGSYAYPFKTLAQGTSAVKAGGTIIFKTAGTSSETMTIKKAMNLNASDGADTIGH